MPLDLARIETWIFDLDNTLYPPSTRMFDQIDRRMGLYIQQLLGCDADEALRVQKLYFHEHGTTLAGLLHYHTVDPHEFLGFVHDISMEPLAAAPRLAPLIAALPGRKLICTNGDAPYARRVLGALGLADSFEAIWDIHAMHYRPKPNASAYEAMLAALEIDPHGAVFIEDSAQNLKVPRALGMQTVWLDIPTEWSARGLDRAAVDLEVTDLAAWLASLVSPAKAD